MDYLSLIKELTTLGPRFAEKEMQAAKLLEKSLTDNNVAFTLQPFKTDVPVVTKAELLVDGENIPCLGSTMVSGDISDGKYLISHFGFSGKTPYNIAYSPITDGISVVDHLKVPSITISRKDVIKIIMAKEVKGRVEVERRTIETENILAGNTTNPQKIVFAHFDSIIGGGAVDNAGSVAVMLNCLLNNPDLLATTLFNFSGNEEIAYDDYKLSGYGFRVFESKYGELFKNAQKIIVLDGVGVGDPSLVQTGLDWVLQLKMLDEIRNKVFWLQNDQTPVLQYFHTKDDRAEILDEKYLLSAEQMLTKTLRG